MLDAAARRIAVGLRQDAECILGVVDALDAGNMRLSVTCLVWCVMLVGAVNGLASAYAQLRGHGGPIRALAVSADGTTVLSGSFDASAIRWSLREDIAAQVLRLHESAVNAVALLNDGRGVTAGADAIIGIWTPGKPAPDAILRGHEGPIVALAVSPDGAILASASWDRTVRLWPLASGLAVVLEGHPAKRKRRRLRAGWDGGGQRRL